MKEEKQKIIKKQEKELKKVEQKQQEIADNQKEALKQAGLALLLIFGCFLIFPLFLIIASVKNMK